MGTYIKTIPPLIALAGDPVKFEFGTTNYITNDGEYAINEIEFYEGGSEDDTIVISWDDGESEVTFTLKDYPDDSGNQILSAGPLSVADWLPYVAVDIQKNYYITKFFDVTYDTTSIYLTAKNKGTTYNCEITTAIDADIWLTAGVDETYRDNYQFNIEVWTEEGPVSQSVESATPDENSEVAFDVSDKLQSIVSTDFLWPENLDDLLIERPGNCKAYYIKYWESWGIPETPQGIKSTDNFYALKGASSFMRKAFDNEELTSFWSRLQITKQFLTLQPNDKKISISQVEKLYFLVYTNEERIKLHAEITFTDKTVESVTLKDIEAGNQYMVYECIVGYQMLDLAEVNPAKTVKSYKIWLKNRDDERISEIRNYIIDRTLFQNKRYFLLESDLGGAYESMRATGVGVSKGKYTRETASMQLPYDYTSKDREIKLINVEEEPLFTINFGWLNRLGPDQWAWKNYCRQIEKSKSVYEVINGRIVACDFTTSEVELHNDNNPNKTHESTYRRAFIDEAYSDDEIPIVGDYSDDHNEDYYI